APPCRPEPPRAAAGASSIRTSGPSLFYLQEGWSLKTGEMGTHLDLSAGGVLATPDFRRARVVLRLAYTGSFAGLGDAPARLVAPPSGKPNMATRFRSGT